MPHAEDEHWALLEERILAAQQQGIDIHYGPEDEK